MTKLHLPFKKALDAFENESPTNTLPDKGAASEPVIMSKSVMKRVEAQFPNTAIREAFLKALRK